MVFEIGADYIEQLCQFLTKCVTKDGHLHVFGRRFGLVLCFVDPYYIFKL